MPKKGKEIKLRGDEKEVRNTAPLWSGSFVYEDTRYLAIEVRDFFEDDYGPEQQVENKRCDVIIVSQNIIKLICHTPYR